MNSQDSNQLLYKLRRYFISGLLIWIPIWITIIVITFLIDILDRTIYLLPQRYHIPGIGVILTLLIIFLTGVLAANYFGKKVLFIWNAFISHIPLARTIHGGVRDVLNVVVKPDGQTFVKVFLVEFPRTGMWTIAFQTGSHTEVINSALGRNKLITLFVPMTPNITSGFVLIVPKDEVVELKMTIEQALKFIISLGVMKPEQLE